MRQGRPARREAPGRGHRDQRLRPGLHLLRRRGDDRGGRAAGPAPRRPPPSWSCRRCTAPRRCSRETGQHPTVLREQVISARAARRSRRCASWTTTRCARRSSPRWRPRPPAPPSSRPALTDRDRPPAHARGLADLSRDPAGDAAGVPGRLRQPLRRRGDVRRGHLAGPAHLVRPPPRRAGRPGRGRRGPVTSEDGVGGPHRHVGAAAGAGTVGGCPAGAGGAGPGRRARLRPGAAGRRGRQRAGPAPVRTDGFRRDRGRHGLRERPGGTESEMVRLL